MVALFNGAGGGAAALVSTVEFYVSRHGAVDHRRRHRDFARALRDHRRDQFRRLDHRVPQAPGGDDRPADHLSRPAGRQRARAARHRGLRGAGSSQRSARCRLAFFIALLAALLLGVLFVLPIGGADMPVVISLLNSFTGLAAAMTGFVLVEQRADHLRRAGRRIGTLLTVLMGKAMNRSLTNVLFGAFGAGRHRGRGGQRRRRSRFAARAPTTSRSCSRTRAR